MVLTPHSPCQLDEEQMYSAWEAKRLLYWWWVYLRNSRYAITPTVHLNSYLVNTDQRKYSVSSSSVATTKERLCSVGCMGSCDESHLWFSKLSCPMGNLPFLWTSSVTQFSPVSPRSWGIHQWPNPGKPLDRLAKQIGETVFSVQRWMLPNRRMRVVGSRGYQSNSSHQRGCMDPWGCSQRFWMANELLLSPW